MLHATRPKTHHILLQIREKIPSLVSAQANPTQDTLQYSLIIIQTLISLVHIPKSIPDKSLILFLPIQAKDLRTTIIPGNGPNSYPQDYSSNARPENYGQASSSSGHYPPGQSFQQRYDPRGLHSDPQDQHRGIYKPPEPSGNRGGFQPYERRSDPRMPLSAEETSDIRRHDSRGARGNPGLNSRDRHQENPFQQHEETKRKRKNDRNTDEQRRDGNNRGGSQRRTARTRASNRGTNSRNSRGNSRNYGRNVYDGDFEMEYDEGSSSDEEAQGSLSGFGRPFDFNTGFSNIFRGFFDGLGSSRDPHSGPFNNIFSNSFFINHPRPRRSQNLFNMLFQQFQGLPSFDFRPMETYFSNNANAGIDINELLGHLASMHPEGQRPANPSHVRSMPTVTVSSKIIASNPTCTVCQEDLKINEPVKKLACEHYFHEDCIMPWLRVQNTCPMCRNPV